MSKTMGMVSLFEMFEDNKDIKEFNEANSKQETKVEVSAKNNSTTANTDTKKAAKKVQAIDPNKKLEEDCAKCEKIVVKVFGQTVFTLEEKEEIKSIKIDDILSRIIENGFEEFSSIKAKWNLSLSNDKKTGYLIPTYANFFAKG